MRMKFNIQKAKAKFSKKKKIEKFIKIFVNTYPIASLYQNDTMQSLQIR